MSDITIKTYTTPCKSRSGNYSDGTTVVQSSGSVSYIGSGGSSVDIVKELGTDTLSDANVFSSLRTIKEITDRGHTHANKSALDNLTQTVIDNSHTHSNKAIIDGITSALVSDWNNAVHKSGDESITGTKTFDNLKCTTSEFTGLMKAASITLTGILTAATINATTINQNGNAVLDASNYTNYTYSQSTIGSLIDTAKTAAINTAKESAASLYLPLKGGEINNGSSYPLRLLNLNQNDIFLRFYTNESSSLGDYYIGIRTPYSSYGLTFVDKDSNYYKILHEGNYASILNSKYLPLTGGTMSNTNLVTNLNADMLDGKHDGQLTSNKIEFIETLSRIQGETVSALKTRISNVLSSNSSVKTFFINVISVGPSLIAHWDDDTYVLTDGPGYFTIKVTNNVGTYAYLEFTSYLDKYHYSCVYFKSIFGGIYHYAFLDDNVASATKLQTARSIWGHIFNGEGDINGDLANLSAINLNGIDRDGLTTWYLWKNNRGFHISPVGDETAGTNFTLTNSGNIGIGTYSPSYKLHVAGTGYFSDAVTLNSTLSVAGLATLNGGISTKNITADSLSVKSFTADISQTLAGSDYLTKSVSKLSENFVIPAVGSSVRIIVDDLEGFPSTACFASGDYIRFRAFNRTSGLTISDAWGTVVLDTTYGTNGFSNGTQAYTFTCTSTACVGLTVYKGSEVLDYGTSGSGLIVRTTLDSAGSPYSQISTWQTDPSNSANYSVHVRLGNLAGLTNCSGYGLYTDNAFLTKQLLVGDLTKTNNYLSYDATNGLVIKGNLYAASGAQVATSTDVTNLNAAIQANASAISLCVTSTTYNQGIASCNTYADNAVSNLQIGGRNLVRNGDFSQGYNYIGEGFGYNTVRSIITDSRFGHCYKGDGYVRLLTNIINCGIVTGDNCVLSFYAKADSEQTIRLAGIGFDTGGGITGNDWAVTLTTAWQKYEAHFSAINDQLDNETIYFYLGEKNVMCYFAQVKLEKGTKATEWSPSPEDVESEITTNSASIAVNSASINSLVSKTDATNNVVATHTTAISQLPDTIDARITTQVSANGSIYNAVASSLTMTAEGISLFGKTIQLNGATTFVSSLNSTAQGYATTAKTEAVAASLSNTTTAINNLSLSGRNLISQNFSTTQSTEEMGEEVWAIVTHNYGDGYKYAKSTRIQFSLSQDMSYVIHINLLSSMIEGKTYTFSFWYKCLGTTSFSLEMGFISETSASTAWKFYSGNITMNSGESRSYIEAFQGIDEQADILISDVTLYEGTKYMGFNLSPEDVNDAMAKNLGYTDYSALNTAATAGTTIITGGKINTALIEATAVLTTALAAHKITASDADITSLQAAIVTANYINSLSITTGNLTVTGGSHLGALTVQTDGSITNGSVLSISAAGKFTGSNVDITGKITATSGSIGAFSIDSYQLTATNGDDSLILNADLIRFLGTTSGVYIGADTFPSSNGGAILSPMRVEVNRSSASTAYGNMGSYYSVQGATSYDDAGLQYTGNNALYIVAGKICGSRFRLRRINTSQTLSKMDSFIITVNNSNTITITLPYGCEDGQWFEIKSDHNSSGNFIVAVPSGSSTTMYWTGSSSTSLTVNDARTYKFVYDAVNDRWAVGISAL